jgi:hypothetical protein
MVHLTDKLTKVAVDADIPTYTHPARLQVITTCLNDCCRIGMPRMYKSELEPRLLIGRLYMYTCTCALSTNG